MQPNTERSSAKDRIEKKRREIRDAMAGLGRCIRQGKDVDLVHWIIPGELACADRPLRYDQRYAGGR